MINTGRLLLCMIVFALLISNKALAQPSTASSQTRPSAEQTLQDILREVRQFRSIVQRMNAAFHRAQITLDRFRQQQEQVNRLTRDLSDLRDRIGDTRSGLAAANKLLEEAEKQKAAGLKGESESKAIGGEIEVFKQREQNLVEREVLLSSELEAANVNLKQLNLRLDELEQEIQAASDEGQPARKRQ